MKAFILAAVLSLQSAFAGNAVQPQQVQQAPPPRVLRIQSYNDNQFIKYFIDDTVVVEPINFSMDTLTHIINNTNFNKKIIHAYHERCLTVTSSDLSTFKPVYLNESCPVELTTKTDLTDFIGLMDDLSLCSFAMLPPGSLRKAMYERVSQDERLKREYFSLERFSEVVSLEMYPECLINDALILFNETLEFAGEMIDRAVKSRYQLLAKFILPSSYIKLSNIDSLTRDQIGFECLEAFLKPIPGTEKFFNSENFFNAFFNTFELGDHLRKSFTDMVYRARPLLAMGAQCDIDGWAVIRRLVKMRLEGRENLKMAAPQLAEFVQILRERSSEEEKSQALIEDIVLNIHQYDQVPDLPCKKVRMTSPNLFDNGTISLPGEFAQLFDETICSKINKAHSINSMTSNYSNPKVFFKFITSLGASKYLPAKHFFAQMYHRTKPFMSARNLEYCRKFASINSINLFDFGTEKFKGIPMANYKIRSMLHSLFFRIGCFGEHMDEGMREMLQAVAELIYPLEVARLKAAIKLVGMTPNIVDLLQITYIDCIWVYEHYGKLYDAEQHNDMVQVFDNKDAFDKLKCKCWIPEPSIFDRYYSLMSQSRIDQIVEKLNSLGRQEQADDFRKFNTLVFLKNNMF